MQAILTKYLGPTEHKRSRIKATAHAGRVIISWDDALGVEENHLAAATALANKFNWLTHEDGITRYKLLYAGELPDTSGNVFAVVPI